MAPLFHRVAITTTTTTTTTTVTLSTFLKINERCCKHLGRLTLQGRLYFVQQTPNNHKKWTQIWLLLTTVCVYNLYLLTY